MSAIGILAIGSDAAWRVRLQRVFALRSDVHWMGAHAPGARRTAQSAPADLLLLDGDDPRIERRVRREHQRAPRRLYFFRRPDAAALRQCLRHQSGGCMGKDASVDALCRAVRAADAGLFVCAPDTLLASCSCPVRRYRQPRRMQG